MKAWQDKFVFFFTLGAAILLAITCVGHFGHPTSRVDEAIMVILIGLNLDPNCNSRTLVRVSVLFSMTGIAGMIGTPNCVDVGILGLTACYVGRISHLLGDKEQT